MRFRLKTWLLIAILAFSANFGVSRVAPPRDPSGIVCVLANHSASETVIEIGASCRPERPTLICALTDHPRPCAGLDSPLFQRPPPVLLS